VLGSKILDAGCGTGSYSRDDISLAFRIIRVKIFNLEVAWKVCTESTVFAEKYTNMSEGQLEKEEQAVSKVKKCPKCSGKMVIGSDQNLNDYFRCTRPPPDSKKHEQYDYKVQPYFCEICGYVEFYREKKE